MDDKHERPLPAIEGLAVALRWAEEIISTVSGVALTVALSFPVLNIFSDGKFYAISANLELIAALAMTVGVDGQLLGSAYRLSQRINYREWGGVAFEAFNVVILALTVYLGAYVSGYQETFSVTTASAFSALGLDKAQWLGLRVSVAVYLLVLSGLRRYVKPKRQQSAEEIEAEAERKRRTILAQAKVRRAQLDSMIGVVKSSVNHARGIEDTPQQPDDQTVTNQGQEDDQTVSKPLPKAAGIAKDKMTASMLVEYIKDTYHDAELSLEDAKDIIKQLGGKEQATEAQGQPYIASKRKAIAWAKKQFSSAKVVQMPKRKEA